MDNNYQITIHDQRELNKIGLDTFYFNKYNVFDQAIDKLIADKKDLNRVAQQEYDSLGENILKKIYDHNINNSLLNRQMNLAIEKMHNEEELKTLIEMKIIHAYKFFEVNIKTLLRAAFNINNARVFYKWENIISFLKEKGIDFAKINGYNELNQLRVVNNTLKHSSEFNNKFNTISEFSNSTELTIEALEAFYDRVQKYPLIFSQNLSSAIYKVLYTFDDDRINKIVKSIALRMDLNDAEKLSNALLKCYK